MKPRLFVFLSILIVLTACTGGPSPTAAVTEDASPTETRAPASATPTRAATEEIAPQISLAAEDIAGTAIEFWHPWEGGRGALMRALVAEFNAQNDYSLQVQAVFQRDLHEAVLHAAGQPDLAVGYSYHTEAWLESIALVDLAPYIKDTVWGLSAADRDDFISTFQPPSGPNGEQFGLPFFRTAEVLLYNRSWAGELGFASSPSTIEALAEQLCAANAALRTDSDPSNDGDGGIMLGFEAPALAAWMTAFGGSIEPVTGAYGFDRPENEAAFIFLRTLLDDHCAWTPAGVYPHDEFAARRGLVLPSTLAGVAPQAEAMAAAGNDDDWAVLPYPTEDGAGLVLFSGPDLMIFPSTEKEQLAAWVFAAWLASPDVQARWAAETGYFPVRHSTLEFMGDSLPGGEAWLDLARPFHPPGSWTAVQWVVSDFSQVLFAPLTTAADIPDLVLELDAFAEEVDGYQ